jgi:hypothetical protein
MMAEKTPPPESGWRSFGIRAPNVDRGAAFLERLNARYREAREALDRGDDSHMASPRAGSEFKITRRGHQGDVAPIAGLEAKIEAAIRSLPILPEKELIVPSLVAGLAEMASGSGGSGMKVIGEHGFSVRIKDPPKARTISDRAQSRPKIGLGRIEFSGKIRTAKFADIPRLAGTPRAGFRVSGAFDSSVHQVGRDSPALRFRRVCESRQRGWRSCFTANSPANAGVFWLRSNSALRQSVSGRTLRRARLQGQPRRQHCV